jgi:Asp-tRNA(Asn)/Glu-tRNA(Gln) amidotransferase C subunit
MNEIFLSLCLLLVVPKIYSSPLENMRSKTSIGESLDTLDVLQDIQDNDFAKDILNGGKNLLQYAQKLQKTAKEVYEKQIKQTQETLTAIMQGVEQLDDKHKTIAAEALTEILKIKTTLRLTRTELNELAERIIEAMDEFKATAQTIFNGEVTTREVIDLRDIEVTTREDIDLILSYDVENMKNLIKEGQTLIDKAQEAYAHVGTSLAKVEDNLIKYKIFVEMIVNDETRTVEEHDNVVTISRASLYTSCVTSTTVCMFVDIFATWGLCSAINGATCASLIASTEAVIAAVRNSLVALEGRAEQAHTTITELQEDQRRLMTYFVSEKEFLGRLDAKLTSANTNLDRSRRVFYINLPTLRNRYIQSLDNLKKAAQDYLNQPELDF